MAATTLELAGAKTLPSGAVILSHRLAQDETIN
jgi:hypothetical protein